MRLNPPSEGYVWENREGSRLSTFGLFNGDIVSHDCEKSTGLSNTEIGIASAVGLLVVVCFCLNCCAKTMKDDGEGDNHHHAGRGGIEMTQYHPRNDNVVVVEGLVMYEDEANENLPVAVSTRGAEAMVVL